MKMRTAQVLGVTGLMAMGILDCRKVSKDTDKVIATVAGEKITAGKFHESTKLLLQDDKKVDDLLKNEAMKEQRNEFLESLALQKAMIRFAKAEGLDKDPKAQLLMEQKQAQLLFQLLMERRLSKVEPTEAQLRALYDELIAKRKAAGQDKKLPSFEDVKTTMPGIWKQDQQQKISEAILKDVKQRFPVTFAEGYKPVKPAGE